MKFGAILTLFEKLTRAICAILLPCHPITKPPYYQTILLPNHPITNPIQGLSCVHILLTTLRQWSGARYWSFWCHEHLS